MSVSFLLLIGRNSLLTVQDLIVIDRTDKNGTKQ
jgi:hypothetical protein